MEEGYTHQTTAPKRYKSDAERTAWLRRVAKEDREFQKGPHHPGSDLLADIQAMADDARAWFNDYAEMRSHHDAMEQALEDAGADDDVPHGRFGLHAGHSMLQHGFATIGAEDALIRARRERVKHELMRHPKMVEDVANLIVDAEERKRKPLPPRTKDRFLAELVPYRRRSTAIRQLERQKGLPPGVGKRIADFAGRNQEHERSGRGQGWRRR
jgi:hypothetical protein